MHMFPTQKLARDLRSAFPSMAAERGYLHGVDMRGHAIAKFLRAPRPRESFVKSARGFPKPTLCSREGPSCSSGIGAARRLAFLCFLLQAASQFGRLKQVLAQRCDALACHESSLHTF